MIKMTVNYRDLLTVSKAVSSASQLKGHTHFPNNQLLFEVKENGEVTIKAYDRLLEGTIRIEAKVEGEGTFLCHALTLVSILSKCDKTEGEATIWAEGNEVVLQLECRKYVFPASSLKDEYVTRFPNFLMTFDQLLELDTDLIRKQLERASLFADMDDEPIGSQVIFQDGKVRAMGKRGLYEEDCEKGLELRVPGAYLRAVLNFLESLEHKSVKIGQVDGYYVLYVPECDGVLRFKDPIKQDFFSTFTYWVGECEKEEKATVFEVDKSTLARAVNRISFLKLLTHSPGERVELTTKAINEKTVDAELSYKFLQPSVERTEEMNGVGRGTSYSTKGALASERLGRCGYKDMAIESLILDLEALKALSNVIEDISVNLRIGKSSVMVQECVSGPIHPKTILLTRFPDLGKTRHTVLERSHEGKLVPVEA